MINERALRLRLFYAVEPALHSQPDVVLHAVSKFLAGIALANSKSNIPHEGEELVCQLAGQLVSYLSFELRALGAQWN